ncbi:unnamed protein product, partial [Phaeothamnion confervicola]
KRRKIEEYDAYLQYVIEESTIDLYHTFVSPKHRKKGLAALLCHAAFEFARREGLKVIPSCSYVHSRYLRR